VETEESKKEGDVGSAMVSKKQSPRPSIPQGVVPESRPSVASQAPQQAPLPEESVLQTSSKEDAA
jgi:hypothetical protein